MKFISWNVNGLRACIKKDFNGFLETINADFICIQETKMQEYQLAEKFNGYYHYFNSAVKLGYSGTLILTKHLPLNVYLDFSKYNQEIHNDEGRIVTLEYNGFYLVNVYVPNSGNELKRLPYRRTFNEDFKNYLVTLGKEKPVIICGDLNVAHQPIDLKNPKTNTKNAGFTLEERLDFTNLLYNGFIDTFRYLHPERIQYSWWSNRFNARLNNVGWRIDYFLITKDLVDKLSSAYILDDIMGSDHCPVGIEIDVQL